MGLVIVGVTLGGLGIVAGAAGLTGGSPAVAATTTAAAEVPSFDSLLDGRSPGSRGPGWLLDTKPGYGTSDVVERVLPSVRRRPGAYGAPPGSVPGVPVVPSTLLSEGDVPADGVPGVDGPGSFAGVPGGFPIPSDTLGGFPGGGGAPGGGVIGGGNPGGGEPGTETPTPVSPVPEPATWMMLILGFMLIGTALRHRGTTLAVPA